MQFLSQIWYLSSNVCDVYTNININVYIYIYVKKLKILEGIWESKKIKDRKYRVQAKGDVLLHVYTQWSGKKMEQLCYKISHYFRNKNKQ